MTVEIRTCFAQTWLKERPQPPEIRFALAEYARKSTVRRAEPEPDTDPAVRARWHDPTAADAQDLAQDMATRIRRAALLGRHQAALFEIPLDVFDTTTEKLSCIAVPAAYSFEDEVKAQRRSIDATRLYSIAPRMLRHVLDLHQATLSLESEGEIEGYDLLFASGGSVGTGPVHSIVGYTILRPT